MFLNRSSKLRPEDVLYEIHNSIYILVWKMFESNTATHIWQWHWYYIRIFFIYNLNTAYLEAVKYNYFAFKNEQ